MTDADIAHLASLNGPIRVLTQAAEEHAEAAAAFLRYARAVQGERGVDSQEAYAHLCEELADVSITVAEVLTYYRSLESDMRKPIERKILRALERLSGGTNDARR